MPEVKLVSITPNYKELLLLACGKPYGKDVSLKGLKHIIEAGHLSVLEHCYASFEVKCSVRVLGQLTRHRHLSFTCQSARGKEFDTFVDPALDLTETVSLDNHAIGNFYRHEVWKGTPLEDAAYYLPQGIQTSIVVTGNFRAWFEYLPKRECKRAMPEHRKLAFMIHEILLKEAPEVFEYCKMHCDHCSERSCEFH